MKLLFSPTFIRASKRLIKRNQHLKLTVRLVLEALETDIYSPSLRSHKLKGKFADYWACSVTYDIRIIFKIVEFENEEAILLQTIGTHDEIY